MVLTKDTDIIKHSAAIQITNEINLLQRRAWNALLGNAYPYLPHRDTHKITLKELSDALGYDSRNEAHLKESLKELVKTTVEWNLLGKDKEAEWGVSGLLADVRIRKGTVYYSYGSYLKGLLYSPRMYAKISLSLQNKFKSKHALALYELFVDYLDVSRGEGETPFISVDQFRHMMGIQEGQYSEFKTLNKWVITDPLKEINKKTNLTVEPKYKRESRRVVSIKFYIKQTEETPLLPTPEFDSAPITVSDIKIKEVRIRGEKQFVSELRKRKISKKDAEELVKQHEEKYLEQKIEYFDWLKEEAKAGRIPKNQAPRTGKWLKNCITEDWQPPDEFKTRAERANEKMQKQLLQAAQWHFQSSEYEKAKEKAEQCLKYGQNAEVSKIVKESEEKIEDERQQKEVEKYLDSLEPEQIEALHNRAEGQLEERLTPAVFAMFMKRGRESPAYLVEFNAVALKQMKIATTQMNLL